MFKILYTKSMKPSNIDLNYTVPIVSSDGNIIFVSSENDVPTLVFFQVRKQSEDSLSADVVAAVRFNTLKDFKEFHKSLGETIKQHENREK